jgi:Mg2+ and Co2+ transporter CorA
LFFKSIQVISFWKRMELLNWLRSGNSSEVVQWFNNSDISDHEKKAAAFGSKIPGKVTLLHWAASYDLETVIELLLQNYPELINQRDAEGTTALHWAAGEGKLNALRLLLKHGAEISSRDYQGETPLFHACLNGHLQTCVELLKHNADPNIQNDRGQTPLHVACLNRQLPVVSFLLQHPHINTSLNTRDKSGRLPIEVAKETNDQILVDYFDPSKRETHEKIFLLESRVKELEANLHAAEETNAAANVKYSNLFKEYKTLEEKLQTTNKQLEDLQLRLKVAEAKNRVFELQLADLQKQCEQLKAKNNELERYVSQTKKPQTQLSTQNERDDLKQKFGLAQSSLTNLQKLLEATEIAIRDTKNQLYMVQDQMGI